VVKATVHGIRRTMGSAPVRKTAVPGKAVEQFKRTVCQQSLSDYRDCSARRTRAASQICRDVAQLPQGDRCTFGKPTRKLAPE
jgi:hypothetical protein